MNTNKTIATRTRARTRVFALTLTAAAAVAACGGGSDSSSDQPQTVSVQFAVTNGSTPVKCGDTLTGLSTTQASAAVHDLRFYITNLALVNDQGVAVPVTLDANEWQLTRGGEAVSLIDLEDATGACDTATNTKETHAAITGTVPAGTYVGLKATMGVPDQLNHSAIAGGAAPLDIAAMAWSWQSGRKFAKLELDPVGGLTTAPSVSNPHGGTGSTFYLHIGSTGCAARTDANGAAVLDSAGNPTYSCAAPNLMDFSLAAFNPSSQQVVLDLGQLLSGSDITQDGGGAPGCMSGTTDPECPAIFNQLQINFGAGADGLPINGGAAQKIFRAAAK